MFGCPEPPRRRSRVALRVAILVLVHWGAIGCERPPRSESSLPKAGGPESPTTSFTDDASSSGAPLPNPSVGVASSVTPGTHSTPPPVAPPVEEPFVVPPLFGEDGKPLPQTEEKPTPSSASLRRRLELLVEAIVNDEPALALPCFFPVEAYSQVKAIKEPERDWRQRLVSAFERNIHEYHRKLRPVGSGVRLLRVEIPETKVKWMKPGSEGNRVGYHRVLRSKLVVATAQGDELPLELTSMISWRGEWYIVHLHGFE